jgi:hypothetical protein
MIKMAGNLLRGLLDTQFEAMLAYLDPHGWVKPSPPGTDRTVDRARRVEELIQLMIQRGFPSLQDLQELILAVRSPFSPFDGKTLRNWIGLPPDCWQAVDYKILGAGSDNLMFSDPSTPEDLQYASIITWEGLTFRDGELSAWVRLPFLSKGCDAGLVMRNIPDRTALIGLLRDTNSGAAALELWRRVGPGLDLVQSASFRLTDNDSGSYHLTCGVRLDCASLTVASDRRPDETSACFTTTFQMGAKPGHFGLIKFNDGAVAFTDLKLTVYKRTKSAV